MATSVARSQITIVDLNDAKAIHAYLTASQGETQIYNPDTKVYTPSYATVNNVITPAVYETGNANNLLSQCSNFKYTINGTAYTVSNSNASYAVDASGKLTIKSNITSANMLNIVFSCDFRDSSTGTTTPVQATMTIAKSQSAGALFQAVINAPKGNVFDTKNSSANLTAVCTCFRGGTADTSNLTYVWEQFDIATQAWKAVAAGRAAGATLTVQPGDVTNFQIFRVTVTDTGGNDAAASAVAMITFQDLTDPFVLELVSTTGDKIVNGTGSTTVNASVWQSGAKIEDQSTAESGRKFVYTWTKMDRNGAPSNWHGTTSNVKTGNPITVAAADVNGKAVIYCEITKK